MNYFYKIHVLLLKINQQIMVLNLKFANIKVREIK
jgi:hypothetical protein